MTFKKGKSGNPGGRPKALKEVQDLARTYTVESIRKLGLQLDNPDGRVVVAAAKELLDRAWGKPEQQIDIDATGFNFVINIAEKKLPGKSSKS